MEKWDVVLVIISLVGLAAAIIGPIVKLKNLISDCGRTTENRMKRSTTMRCASVS